MKVPHVRILTRPGLSAVNDRLYLDGVEMTTVTDYVVRGSVSDVRTITITLAADVVIEHADANEAKR